MFAVTARFRAGAEAQRQENHEAFSDHLAQRGLHIRLVGSLRDEAGGRAGVLALIEGDDLAQVRRFLDASPYNKAGLYERIDVEAFDLEVGSLG